MPKDICNFLLIQFNNTYLDIYTPIGKFWLFCLENCDRMKTIWRKVSFCHSRKTKLIDNRFVFKKVLCILGSYFEYVCFNLKCLPLVFISFLSLSVSDEALDSYRGTWQMTKTVTMLMITRARLSSPTRALPRPAPGPQCNDNLPSHFIAKMVFEILTFFCWFW